jgi:sulfonate transport system substrate-binding protein
MFILIIIGGEILNKIILTILVMFFLVATIFLIGCTEINKEEDQTNIRVGWQTPWATQGQLTQILKNTSILEQNDLFAEFKGFSYGGPLNEAALAKEVDVLFTADQPAAMLISKNDDWVIIGRLMYNRVSLYVPPNSPIQNVEDLKGKTVAMPFGAAAQRMALKAQKDAGLDPNTDVTNINLGIYEQSDLVKDPNAIKWGNIDAMAGFDPTPAIFEEKGLVRNLKVGKVVSLVVMSKDFINKNPDAPKNFLNSLKESYDFYRLNVEQANLWFTQEANLDITANALKIASDIEPNLKANSKEEIRLDFTEEDYVIMQEAADFLFENNMLNRKIIMEDYINLSYLSEVK